MLRGTDAGNPAALFAVSDIAGKTRIVQTQERRDDFKRHGRLFGIEFIGAPASQLGVIGKYFFVSSDLGCCKVNQWRTCVL